MKLLKDYLERLHKVSFSNISKQIQNYDMYDLQIYDSCINHYNDNIDSNNLYAKFPYNSLSINESHSVFAKCREIVDFITKTLICCNYFNSDKSFLFMCDNIEEIRNDYFRTIYVTSTEYIENNAEYEIEKTNNVVDDKMDYVMININSRLKPSEIYDKIEHELTHAYEDFKRQLNGSENMYVSTFKRKFDKLELNDKDSELMQKLKMLLYFLDPSEQNAYLAQFDGILGNIKYKTVAEAYDRIYHSKLYRDIKEISSILFVNDESISKEICLEYRNIYSSNESDSTILKKIMKSWNKFQEHFRRNIYQCVCDHVEKHEARDKFATLGVDDNVDFESLLKRYMNVSIFVE